MIFLPCTTKFAAASQAHCAAVALRNYSKCHAHAGYTHPGHCLRASRYTGLLASPAWSVRCLAVTRSLFLCHSRREQSLARLQSQGCDDCSPVVAEPVCWPCLPLLRFLRLLSGQKFHLSCCSLCVCFLPLVTLCVYCLCAGIDYSGCHIRLHLILEPDIPDFHLLLHHPCFGNIQDFAPATIVLQIAQEGMWNDRRFNRCPAIALYPLLSTARDLGKLVAAACCPSSLFSGGPCAPSLSV
jgi:hypothetical protein